MRGKVQGEHPKISTSSPRLAFVSQGGPLCVSPRVRTIDGDWLIARAREEAG